jgi:glycosyltransferase involved in cell wall biosynthesis
MSSFCAYLTHLLHISDPISWLISANPCLVSRDGDTERWTLPEGCLAYPLGANGFIFRRADLESVKANEHFQDTHVALHLMKAGQREWLRIRGRGVHHYYVQTLWGFVKKRRRATVHFLRVQQKMPVNWMKEKPPVPTWLAGVYCATLIGPLWHTIRGLVRDRDWRWLWHTPASVGSLLGAAWGVWTYKTHRSDPRLVANLQVKQTLKNAPAHEATGARPRLVCFVNGIYSSHFGGGDIYFKYIAQAALDAGCELHFFGGHALKGYLQRMGFPENITLTDRCQADLGNVNALGQQLRLLLDFARRLWGTLRCLKEVRPADLAYAMSDYWFDSIPLMLCRARAKVMYLGMMAPTLGEIVRRARPDVTGSRLNSIYYWASQQFSIRAFRWCRNKKFSYGHPEMRAYLRRFGYKEEELALVSNGMDVSAADRTPAQPKEYDLVWTGRVHPQKGIDDLLATFQYLSQRMENFHAIIIGSSHTVLAPRVKEMGLERHVTFAGLVSEEEKFRLLKASDVFVMPSRYESWGIVVGEALASGVPVVAYELSCYRPVFGDFVRYVKPFDREQWLAAVEREVREMRAGRNYLDAMDLAGLKKSLSWTASQRSFRDMLKEMVPAVTAPE